LATQHWLCIPERVQHKVALLTNFFTAVHRDILELLSPSLTWLVGELCGQQAPAS